MLKILAVIGWILLCLLILLVWVLIVPRSIYLEYSKKYNLVVRVRVFLFKIKVYPFKLPFAKELTEEEKAAKKEAKNVKKAKKTGKSEPVKKKNKTEQNGEDKKGFDIMDKLPKGMELAKTVLSAVKGVFHILLNGIRIKDVSFNMPINGKDAYDVQNKYGKITSAFYSFNIFLQKYVKIFYKSPVFIADFNNLYKDSVYFYCKIQASPSIILAVGWHLIKIYLSLDKNNSKEKIDKTEKEK